MNVWEILERAREGWPRSESVVDGSRRFTWKQTAGRVTALAERLREHGLAVGDRVAILAPNSCAFLETYFAAAGLGAIAVPLNVRLAARELAEVLGDAAPVALVADASYERIARQMASDASSLRWIVWVGKPGNRGLPIATSDYESLAGSGRVDFEPAEVGPADVAQIYYTSGTTGRPKGVMLTHENVCTHALAATSELDLAEDDVWGHVAPMFHLADAWATFAITLVGGKHVMSPRFEPTEVLDLMQAEGVTITNLVPTMLQRLLAESSRVAFDPSSLRTLLTGGAAIATEVVRRVLEVFACEYVQTYGMTETSPYLTLSLLRQHHLALPFDEQLRVRSRTGRPFETVELEVVDDEDRRVPDDDRTVGEIRVRGRTVSPGYWNQPEETALAFRDGWLYTGDLAVVDAEGYVDIVDRKKDMIVTGGENVYSTEVENALYEHPDVLEAAVYGVPDPEWGEAVRASVVPMAGATLDADELEAFCRERLAAFKCPRRIDVVDELPKTGSGKIQKSELREGALTPGTR